MAFPQPFGLYFFTQKVVEIPHSLGIIGIMTSALKYILAGKINHNYSYFLAPNYFWKIVLNYIKLFEKFYAFVVVAWSNVFFNGFPI